MADKTFTIEYDGLKLVVEATDNGDGTLSIKVLCVDGYANINAFYWSDGDDTGGEGSMTGFNAKKDASLNMNGTDVDWDSGVKLSDAGLGKTPPPTYLQEGGSYSFNITASLDDLDTIGIRATSTSTAEGSIKGVAQEDEPEEPTDHFPEWTDHSISHVTFYFDTADGFVGDVAGIDPENDGKGPQSPDGWFTVKFDDNANLSDDLDDWFDDALAYIQTQNPTLDTSTLVGVSIKGGTSEVWYDLDNDPNDDDSANAPSIWIAENKEVDQSYNVIDSDPFTVAV